MHAAPFGALYTQTSDQTNKQLIFFIATLLWFWVQSAVYRLLTPKRMTRQESLDSSDMTVGGYTSLWR